MPRRIIITFGYRENWNSSFTNFSDDALILRTLNYLKKINLCCLIESLKPE